MMMLISGFLSPVVLQGLSSSVYRQHIVIMFYLQLARVLSHLIVIVNKKVLSSAVKILNDDVV